MKYVIFIPDGSSDYPVDELEGKTPLMVAYTPNIDRLAKKGFGGFAIPYSAKVMQWMISMQATFPLKRLTC